MHSNYLIVEKDYSKCTDHLCRTAISNEFYPNYPKEKSMNLIVNGRNHSGCASHGHCWYPIPISNECPSFNYPKRNPKDFIINGRDHTGCESHGHCWYPFPFYNECPSFNSKKK